MTITPLFSICIPCFNHEKYIGNTISHVLDQDFSDFEIIVADNASTDHSAEVVEAFHDPRIRLLRNRFNIGFAPNLQQVTRNARGRFLNLLSSDDVMNQGTLSTYADLIAMHQREAGHLVLMSQAWEIDEHGKSFRYITKSRDKFAPVRVQLPTMDAIESQNHHEIYSGFSVFTDCMKNLDTAGIFCSVVYSRALWEAVEGYNSTQLINPDMHFIVKVLRLDPLVIYINHPLYSYRSHQMGQARQNAGAKLLKLQIDNYNYLMQYDDSWLSQTGVSRKDQQQLFVNRDCLSPAFVALSRGAWLYASRLLAFAWSAYPEIVVRQKKSCLIVLMLFLGPIGIMLTHLFYRLHIAKSRLPRLEEISNGRIN